MEISVNWTGNSSTVRWYFKETDRKYIIKVKKKHTMKTAYRFERLKKAKRLPLNTWRISGAFQITSYYRGQCMVWHGVTKKSAPGTQS